MASKEYVHILAAVIILTVIIAALPLVRGDWQGVAQSFFFAVLILAVAVAAKKLVAYLLDADVEHEMLTLFHFGLKPHWHFQKPVPIGIIIPLFFAIFTLGRLKVMTLLSYEARASKYRAAKRFGHYSYAEMTDWHNSIIGAGGIIAVLLLAAVSYFLPYNAGETLARLATFYAFWNMLPLFKLDGAQIFFGGRVLYTILAVITLIFTGYAILPVLLP